MESIKEKNYKIINTSLSKTNKIENIINYISPKNNRNSINKSPFKLIKLKLNSHKQKQTNITNSHLTSYSLFPKLSQISLSPDTTTVKSEINNNKKIKHIHCNKKVNRDLLTFDPCLKMLNDNLDLNPYNKKLIEDRMKKKNELYFDYDKNNDYFKYNSFSGNDPSLLKSKILFVKGVYDYIYPRLVIKRMKFLESQNRKEIKENVIKLNKEFNKNKIFIKRYKTPEEKIRISKYELNGAFSNEAIKSKGNLIRLKKIFINRHLVTKLAKIYDYKG